VNQLHGLWTNFPCPYYHNTVKQASITLNMHTIKPIFSMSYLLDLALALLLLFFAAVGGTTITRKSQTYFGVSAWARQSNSSSSMTSITNMTKDIPTGESIYKSKSMTLPTSVGSYIILIANEAHESWQDEKHKLITDKNPYYIPN
jgi:hypothetical protein